MLALTGSLKRRLSDAYLAGSAEFTHIAQFVAALEIGTSAA
jgi:hypothetical protein